MTRISAIEGDITTLEVDCIVNAANTWLTGGGGVDGAIHRAGGLKILEECQAWVASNGPLPTGKTMVTGAGDLPSRLVIHTVGPIWSEYDEPTAKALLGSCYLESLDRAVEHDCRTIAFPNISTGVYGFPKESAAATAVAAVRAWEGTGVDSITFVCFNEDNLRIYSRLLES